MWVTRMPVTRQKKKQESPLLDEKNSQNLEYETRRDETGVNAKLCHHKYSN